MNTFLDDSLVGIVLLISAGYALSALGPRNLRRRLLTALSAGLGRAPAAFGLRRAAQRIADAAQTKPQGACGGCDNCGTETPGTETPGNRAPAPGVATEIKVPIASIGRARNSRQG
jgi:hypothetical protein